MDNKKGGVLFLSLQRFSTIYKRDGSTAPYQREKILAAINKAADATQHTIPSSQLSQILEDVELDLINQDIHTPSIEKIQDEIEHALMLNKYFDIAKAYILYRQKHAEHRSTKEKHASPRKKEEEARINIVHSDGTPSFYDRVVLKQYIEDLTRDLDPHEFSVESLLTHTETNLFSGITSIQILDTLMLAATGLIEYDPSYEIIASRILLKKIYKETFTTKIASSNLKENYMQSFKSLVNIGFTHELFNQEMHVFDIDTLATALKPEYDNLLKYTGIKTLHDRYFLKHNKRCIEAPQHFWMRVAMGLSYKEKNPNERAIEFYELISQLYYIPSTPTLFHSGLARPQLSSCYITTISDDLHTIFKCIGDNAQMAKWSGGIGNDWTPIRATGTHIKSTNVESQGIIPFLKIANDTTLAINRSGKRRGATCAYLETWHLDIEDFLDLKRNTGDERRRTHDMNTANWVPDLFMKRVKEKATWTLFSPNETGDLHELYGQAFEDRYHYYESQAQQGLLKNHRTIEAEKLWKKMLTRLFETGHPWITFKDPCNIRSPQDHQGVIHSSNLCTEITLNTSDKETAVCNLGSINLSRHVEPSGINQYRLQQTIKTAMRMLDNVIDINFYPTQEAHNSNQKHRPVGLGIMGVQDMLFTLGIPFESEACVELMDTTMEFISYHALLSSSELAKERGSYESYEGSKWSKGILPLDTLTLLEQERKQKIPIPKTKRLDWQKARDHIKAYGMRNSNTMAIAPTATISNISGCFPCIEPAYKNIYVKSNMSGEFTVINTFLVRDLKSRGLWSKAMLDKIKYFDGNIKDIQEIPQEFRTLYKEAFEIDPVKLIRLTAVRGKWIDQSQSHNIFLKGASGKVISETYLAAWEMGLKTTYYLRSLAASQIEKTSLNAQEFGYTQKRQYSLSQHASKNTNGTPTDDTPAPTKYHTENTVFSSAEASSTEAPLAQLHASDDISEDSLLSADIHQSESPTQETQADSVITSACSIMDPDCEVCQ